MPRESRPRRWSIVAFALVALSLVWPASPHGAAALPDRLSDAEFWQLSQRLSEPDGTFRSDNLVSNETGFQIVIPDLTARLGTDGVYLGVGPEQNFTYIAALEPRIAFIIDIRRGNRDLHLMYKALFEMAADRAEFLSLLFARPRPDDLPASPSAAELFSAFDRVAPSDELYAATLTRIEDRLVATHGFALSDDELQGIEYVYSNFHHFGPGLGYSSSSTGRGEIGATYAVLMQTTDAAGVPRSYLATEANFRTVKALESANLVVPVVGNFAGPKAVRDVGSWLRDRGANVSAWYLSNVEDYLSRDGTWLDFCRNAATLPLDDDSTFIRSGGGYRPPTTGAPAVSVGTATLSADQVRLLLGTVTTTSGGVSLGRLPDGVRSSVVVGSAAGLGPANRLGFIREDIKPCMAPGGG